VNVSPFLRTTLLCCALALSLFGIAGCSHSDDSTDQPSAKPGNATGAPNTPAPTSNTGAQQHSFPGLTPIKPQ